ncbi:MAG: hypothetical protein ACE5OP_12680 [Candidatus Glassbacteria bacterium]
MKFLICLSATSFTLLFSIPMLSMPSPLFGSSTDNQLSVNTQIEVNHDGAFTRTTVDQGNDSFVIDRSKGEVTLSPPNLQWVIDDGGQLYIPTSVELGGRGTVAFYGCYLNNERNRLFSTLTSSSAEAPVWEDEGLLEAWSDIYVDASEDGNILTAIAQFPVEGDITRREVKVYKYTTDSSTPDWVYTFPNIINAGARIKISRDGAYIAAALYDNNTSTLEIAYFESDSPTPLFTDSFSSSFIRALDMTDNGGILYINEGTMIHIYDTSIQSIIFSVNAGASFDSHSISGDGSAFAFGGFNFVKCYGWNGSSYELLFTYWMSGSTYCARCDLSTDASTLAAAFYVYSPGLDFRVVSLEVPSGDVDFEADFTGTGDLQNAPWQIVTNDDGSRIAYGGWGDEGNTNPEVMIFEGSATPVASIDTRGSVFDVDISANGVFVVSGSKSVHANISGNGGDHACYYMGGQDLMVEGVPGLGDIVTFQIEGDEGENVLLAASFNEVDISTPFGTLVVDPGQYIELGTGTIGPSGLIEFDVTVPNLPILLGRKVVTQAILWGGGNIHLTNGQVFLILP